MRAKLYTADGTLGVVDLVDGADVADVVRAIREHRLFISTLPDPIDPTTVSTTLPGSGTLDDPPPRRRRGA